MSNDQPSFGALLRYYRSAAKLTQEALAERAGRGVDTIGALERGVTRAPYRNTVLRLSDALLLSTDDRAKLETAAAQSRRRKIVEPSDERPTQTIPTVALPPSNLPLSFADLIGRDDMLAELMQLVPAQRHVTLVGSGGIGKTHAAQQLGRALLSRFADGVWFVDLVPVSEPSLVAEKVAAVLGIREAGDRPMSEALPAALKRLRLLLILDNCEHVIAAVASLAEAVLAAAPDVRIVATSREPLKIAVEHVYNVSPLDYPAPGQQVTADDALRFGALALLAARASAADQHFRISDDNAELAADICRRVEGNALGIELAASRIKPLGLANLSRRLEHLLPTLTGGRRTARLHHQTLRALIDWSYNLLDEDEGVLLHRVAIFAGGWTLEAAELVCGDPDRAAGRLLELLSGLVDKSQIVVLHGGLQTRYRLLYFVREYALEKLAITGERPVLEYRRAAWVADFAEKAAAAAWTVPRRRWLMAIMPEIDNIRAALAWASEAPDGLILAGRIAADLGLFWYYSGLARESRTRIEMLLEQLGDRAGDELSAKLWGALAALRAGAGRVEAAQRAIELFDRVGDRRRLGISYLQLAIAYRQMTRFAEAEAAIDRTLALFRETGDDRSTYYASALGWRASVLIGLERFDEARAYFEGDIALYETLNDEGLAAVERLNFAELEFAVGNVRQAAELVEHGIRTLRAEAIETKLSNDYSQVVFYLNLAAYRLVLGEIDAAGNAAREALMRARGVHYPLYVAIGVQHCATLAALGRDPVLAARLRGFVDEVYRVEGVQREPTEERLHRILIEALLRVFTASELDRLAAEGARLGQDEAVEAALAIVRPRYRKAESVRSEDPSKLPTQ